MENKDIVFNLISNNGISKNWIDKISLTPKDILKAFVLAPRFAQKEKIQVTSLNSNFEANAIWPVERLVRVYLILLLEEVDPQNFEKNMDLLFDTAEINESKALFSSLFLLKNPQKWLLKATNAVRSNIGDIFDTIAFETPYAFEHFPELAWNQMVLKCIFNDKPIHKILGLDQRANQNLANTLSDFAHERWAAGRTVPSQVWRLVINFINEPILNDLEKLFQSENVKDRLAAYLVAIKSPDANHLLGKYPQNFSKQELALAWENLE